jgi:hypothetical protein
MGKSVKLNTEKIQRLLYFLKNGSVKESCSRFGINPPAFRQSITETTKTLRGFYAKENEYFLGSETSSQDIYTNKDLVYKWYDRFIMNRKPNVVKNNIDWEMFYEDISSDSYFKKFKFTQLDDMCSLIRKHIEKQIS